MKRELTLLKRVFDHRKRRLDLMANPVITEVVKRSSVNDERNVRLDDEQIDTLIHECHQAKKIHGRVLSWELPSRSAPGVAICCVRNGVMSTLGSAASCCAQSRTPGAPKSSSMSLLGFRRARHKLGLDHFRFHDARHELISSLVEAGWSDTQVMARWGHRDPESLNRYTNLLKNHLADALAAIPPRGARKG